MREYWENVYQHSPKYNTKHIAPEKGILVTPTDPQEHPWPPPGLISRRECTHRSFEGVPLTSLVDRAFQINLSLLLRRRGASYRPFSLHGASALVHWIHPFPCVQRDRKRIFERNQINRVMRKPSNGLVAKREGDNSKFVLTYIR